MSEKEPCKFEVMAKQKSVGDIQIEKGKRGKYKATITPKHGDPKVWHNLSKATIENAGVDMSKIEPKPSSHHSKFEILMLDGATITELEQQESGKYKVVVKKGDEIKSIHGLSLDSVSKWVEVKKGKGSHKNPEPKEHETEE